MLSCKRRWLPCITLCVFVLGLVQPANGQAENKSQELDDIPAIVARIRAGEVTASGDLRKYVAQHGTAVVRKLIAFVADDDVRVRREIVIALGGSSDITVVPILEARLKDSNVNVRREAIDAIFRRPRTELACMPRSFINHLGEYASLWDENSYKAVLLLGDLNARSKVSELRAILRQAENIKDPLSQRYVLAPRMKDAATKALFKLKDKEATSRITAAFQAKDVESISFAIQAVVYADREDFVPRLLPLLDDLRDAENIAPSGGRYCLRVRDLAVNAIYDLTHIDFGFKIYRGPKYTDDEAAIVRDRVVRR